ncbi:MAG: M56 family metallopeptidase [Candidatus Latescibacterota bacterium]|nr:MAG: M56 family metallopeptidase [Candidatus Latescibacterota bacterium]
MIDTVASGLGEFWARLMIHLWQVTLIMIPLFFIGRWLRRAPATVVHAVWSTGLIKLLLPLAIFGGLARGVMRLLPDAAGTSATETANTVLVAVTTVLMAPGSVRTADVGGRMFPWVVVGLSALWICGVVWFLVRFGREVGFMRKIAREPQVQLSPNERSKLDNAIGTTGVTSGRIKICKTAFLPSVVGLLRPTIVIPRQLISDLSLDELRAVLVHEDTHRRRFDPLQSVVHRVCAALFFFYPFIWPLLKRLRESAEFACDDAAIERGIARDAYARAISKTLQLGLSPAGNVSMAGSGNASLLRRRLDRLMSLRRSTMSLKYRITVAAVILLAGLGSFWPLQITGEARENAARRVVEASMEENSQKQKDTDAKKKEKTVKAKTVDVYTMEPPSKPPKLLKSEPPYFPEAARASGTGAHVTVRLLVLPDGSADSVTVDVMSRGHGDDFEKSVRDAIATWRFEPGEDENGKPIKAWVKMSIQFKLDDCEERTRKESADEND